MKMNITAEY